MPPERKKIRLTTIDPDIDRENFIKEVQYKHKDCKDCYDFQDWLVCEVCLGPNGPTAPIVIVPVAESKAERRNRYKGYFKRSGENKALRKIKKEIKLGKQSTMDSFLKTTAKKKWKYFLFVVVCLLFIDTFAICDS